MDLVPTALEPNNWQIGFPARLDVLHCHRLRAIKALESLGQRLAWLPFSLRLDTTSAHVRASYQLRKETAFFQNPGGRHRNPAPLAYKASNRRGKYSSAPPARRNHTRPLPACSTSGTRLQHMLAGLDYPLLHEVCHHINPLLVPAHDSRPHLVGSVGLDLPLERAQDRTDDHVASFGTRSRREEGPEEYPAEICSRNVEVGEVCGIRLVEVEIHLHPRRLNGAYCGEEDVMRLQEASRPPIKKDSRPKSCEETVLSDCQVSRAAQD